MGDVARGDRSRLPVPKRVDRLGTAPWEHLPLAARRFTLDDVRLAMARAQPAGPMPAASAGPSGVLVPLFEEDGEARLILTKRTQGMPTHKGDIVFPGGRMQAGDAGPQATALREAHEEIGLDPEQVEIAGQLPSMPALKGTFVLIPFVGLLSGRPHDLRPDPREVEAVFDVSLSELMHEDTFSEELWVVPEWVGLDGASERSLSFFDLPGDSIWGATASVLVEFLELLTSLRV